MGQSQSGETPRQLSTEQLSHELALQFAAKCFTHLEIAHFKDNFKTLADHQEEVEYWKEETLCRFLCLPDALQVGSVIHQMATYLGAFPFPSLAPCILTREAMIKVVTIMTERYGQVLKRGKKDRIRVLFRSLAVVDRSTRAVKTDSEKPTMEQLVAEQKPDDMKQNEVAVNQIRSHVAGFAIDEPADEADDEDDDDLALAALDSLDAIEVFKQDQKIVREKRMHHAQIPIENLKRFLVMLLVLAPLGPQDNVGDYSEGLTEGKLQSYKSEADAMVAAFDPDRVGQGIRYPAFARAMSSFPLLLEPLNTLFEHLLFSRNIDLSKNRSPTSLTAALPRSSPTDRIMSGDSNQSFILTPAILSHLSTFLVTKKSSGPPVNVFHASARFHPIYATSTHGTSLSSFSRHVMSWKSLTLLLVTGTASEASEIFAPSSSSSTTPITIGAFLPTSWSQQSPTTTLDAAPDLQPILFLLSPVHALFPHNPYNRQTSSSTSTSHFSSKAGIALGCMIPPSSHTISQQPILGPVSLRIDQDLTKASFRHDSDQGTGAFLPDPSLELAQQKRGSTSNQKTVELDINSLEVWGLVLDKKSSGQGQGGESLDEVQKHEQRMAWEESEAARRAGVNLGSHDQAGARHLLEMAGIIGGEGATSGGSV